MPADRRSSQFVLALLVSTAIAPHAHARPDPLGERKKPAFERPAPPPAPAPRPAASKDAGASEGDEEGSAPVQNKGALSTARATREPPSRPEAAGTKGGTESSGKSRVLGADDGSYRLGPRDQLRIEVWNRAEVEYEWRPVTVTENGTINMPLLEDVNLGGLTVNAAKEKLTKLYDAYIIGAQVFIQIAEYNSRQVNVIGEVKNPGRYALKGEMRLTELLTEAGDLTKHASKIVRVIRDANADEAPELRDIDLDRIKGGDPTEDIRIQPDDIVSVLPNKSIVYVTGMVKTEGYVDYEEGMTAQQAIILAGGLAEGSAGGRSKVFRVIAGKTTQQRVDVKDQKKPFALQPGDIIHVPKSIL